MGNDAALACLSAEPRPVSDYFKQLFAQVTNPPDRPHQGTCYELVCARSGPESNLLDAGENNCARLVVEHPVLTPKNWLLSKMTVLARRLVSLPLSTRRFLEKARTSLILRRTSTAKGSDSALERALADLCERAARAVQGSYGRDGAAIIVLSAVPRGQTDYPSQLY